MPIARSPASWFPPTARRPDSYTGTECDAAGVVTASDLPADVRSLLDSTITSVEQLELLLLLHREPGRAWTAAAAGRAVHTSEHSAGIRLGELAARGVARETPDGFVPVEDRELGQAVRVLERLYATHRVKIISRIFAKPPDAVRDFADAFRLRRKGDR